MQESELPGLTAQVLWAAFALAAGFGAIAQRTHFCTMGAVADIVNIGDWTRMRMWLLSMAVAMLGFNLMVGLGWVQAGQSVYAAPRLIWLSNLVGGLMFGFGMVLASGCGSKTLVRIGGGSLKSLVVFVVLAIASYATLGLLWKLVNVASAEQPSAGDVGLVRRALAAALDNIKTDPEPDLRGRLGGANRQASMRVREKLRAQW